MSEFEDLDRSDLEEIIEDREQTIRVYQERVASLEKQIGEAQKILNACPETPFKFSRDKINFECWLGRLRVVLQQKLEAKPK